MLESREDLPFAKETREDLVGVHPAFDKLDGNTLVKLAVDTLAEPDGSHSAASYFLEQPICTDDATGKLRRFRPMTRCKLRGACLEECASVVVGRE
jgi:hypothetical protein